MAEQRLIDANEAKKSLLSYYSFVNENTSKSNYTGETLMSYEVADMIEDCIDNAPTIDPETLPIVRQLREENARLNRGISNLAENVKSAYEQRDKIQKELASVTAERDAAVKDADNARQSLMMAMFAKCEFLVKFDSFGKSVQIVRRTDEEETRP